jgi:hypothetical protein
LTLVGDDVRTWHVSHRSGLECTDSFSPYYIAKEIKQAEERRRGEWSLRLTAQWRCAWNHVCARDARRCGEVGERGPGKIPPSAVFRQDACGSIKVYHAYVGSRDCITRTTTSLRVPVYGVEKVNSRFLVLLKQASLRQNLWRTSVSKCSSAGCCRGGGEQWVMSGQTTTFE